MGEDNPIPRTNVAPVAAAPAAPSLYAFSYTQPGATRAPTFIVAGAGELKDRAQGPEGIVRHGDTTPEGMREKARFVMATMQERLRALGGAWGGVTAIDIYTAQPIHALVLDEVLGAGGGRGPVHGVHWYPSRPPIQGLDFEMDMRRSLGRWCSRLARGPGRSTGG